MNIIRDNIEIIHKYIPLSEVVNRQTYKRCEKCIYKTIEDNDTCDDCRDIYDESGGNEFECDFHKCGKLCYVCFHDEKNVDAIIFKIIKKAFELHGVVAFKELNYVLNKNNIVPNILNKLLVGCLKNADDVIKLIKLGANVDMNYKYFNPNFSLLSWCLYIKAYASASLMIQYSNGNIFLNTNNKGMNALQGAISGYIRVYEYNTHHIDFLLKNGAEISDIYLDKLGISGCEYGDIKHFGGGNHHWRRERVRWLIVKGANYNIIRSTRLGKYLCHLSVLREFR